MYTDELKQVVEKFRNAIEMAKANNESGNFFRKFPVGQCDNTSDMLAEYLLGNGFKDIESVNGTYYRDYYEEKYSHTWLVVGQEVVDITGDQFKNQRQPLHRDIPVYVGPYITYYDLFEMEPNSRYKHNGIEKKWSNYKDLALWYDIITSYIP